MEIWSQAVIVWQCSLIAVDVVIYELASSQAPGYLAGPFLPLCRKNGTLQGAYIGKGRNFMVLPRLALPRLYG